MIKDKYIFIFLLGILFAPSCQQATTNENTNEDNKNDPFAIVSPKPQAYKWLSFGEVQPKGWLLHQMRHDLEEGFVGHLDQLVPDLIREDDIYGKDRLTNEVKSKDVGNITEDEDWEVQYLWWNSETQSNWWDGYVRNALLTGHKESLEKTKAYIDRMLSNQDENGYLGIYAPDLRFNFEGENGELWAQSTLFRALLAYYEATGDKKVLDAIEEAVAVTMEAYPVDGHGPFEVKESFGGVGHGLTITDTFDRLYQLTGKEEYMEYALWLYENFSKNKVSQEDARYLHLTDSAYRFNSHGVHTYEQLRPLVTAVYASGNPALEEALDGFMEKLALCLTPSGGPIGDEWIGKRAADASEIGYEYCSIHELLDSYSHLLQKSGNLAMADRMEWLLFNAGQGARHPDGKSIAYLKTDNSFSMTGPLHPGGENQTRYKYSPTHQDAAVCCVPNAGRIYPYYVKAMWLKNEEGLLAALYGPSEVNTSIKGVPVNIREETNFPFELEAEFTISPREPVAFDIALRKPEWATRAVVEAGSATVTEEDGMIRLHKEWQENDVIRVRFLTSVAQQESNTGEYYLSYGPLLYALPLEDTSWVSKTHPVDTFKDLKYKNTGTVDFALPAGADFAFHPGKVDPQNPWDTPLYLSGELLETGSNTLKKVRLVPMGKTVLRRVTFPEKITKD